MPREFEIVLESVNTSEAHFRLDNEIDENGNVKAHRVDTTGTDWKAGLMTVKGRMPTVVHGFESGGGGAPHTLVVLEWFAAPPTLDRRFREVTIEVSFEAHGKRGKAEASAQELRARGGSKSYWDPEVVAFAPYATSHLYHSTHKISEKSGFEFDVKAAFAPWFSGGPKYMWAESDDVVRNDSIRVSGEFARVGSGATHNDAVRWTLLENASQRSGVPAYFRTAVLLRRRARDDGQFVGRVKVDHHSSSTLQDLALKARRVAGRLPRDQPIIFDPRVQTAASESFDAANLVNVSLPKQVVLVSSEPPASLPGNEAREGADAPAAPPEDAQARAVVEVQANVAAGDDPMGA